MNDHEDHANKGQNQDEWSQLTARIEQYFSKLGYHLLRNSERPDFLKILEQLARIDRAPENPASTPENEEWFQSLERVNQSWNLQFMAPQVSGPPEQELWWQLQHRLEDLQAKGIPTAAMSEPGLEAAHSGPLSSLVRRIVNRLIGPTLHQFTEYQSRVLQYQQEFNQLMVQLQNEVICRLLIERQVGFNAEVTRLLNQLVNSVLFSRQQRFNQMVQEFLTLLPETIQVNTSILDQKISKIAEQKSEIQALKTVLEKHFEKQMSDGNVQNHKSSDSETRKQEDTRPSLFSDQLYLRFEDRFRGPVDQIRLKQQKYLAYFKEKSPVIDLACGRGEFLDLLRSNDINARGIDLNPLMIEICQQQGLEVEQNDAFSYLKGVENGSLGGIFCAQFIEHLCNVKVLEFIRLCSLKLQTGAWLIIETPNPESLLVGASTFHRDPTHIQLYHPDTMQFYLEEIGFEPVLIERTSYLSEGQKMKTLSGSTALAQTDPALFNALLYNFTWLDYFLGAPQDYAVIAQKKSH
ncbi:methyltransferase domain-containing protein [bacterium]|nr:methyltransferase domain-containing protein [bacterium]